VPVRGGPHAALALRLAVGLVERSGGSVTALRVELEGSSAAEVAREADELEAVIASAGNPGRVHQLVVRSDSVEQAILAQATSHQAIVMGAAAQADSESPFGPVVDTIRRQLDRQELVVVKTRIPGDLPRQQWEPMLPAVRAGQSDATLTTLVDKWFAENTFDSREFGDLRDLVRLKQRQRLTISLGLPTLDEAETIGEVIRTVREALMERHPLVDELVVIDSGSTDGTRAIAEALGVPVVLHREILPSYASLSGKGEALWKSLYVLSGDLIAWIDTDIRNIHPRFVYGVLGPLLKNPRIKYVKGFYRRPIRAGGLTLPTGGGRVTELTVRPLLNLFYPELSGIIQPLAGEYAARREVLEQLPFLTAYGVEIGQLIDVLHRFGLQSIGQVNLRRRLHRNRRLDVLARMAFSIVAVMLQRLESQGRLQLLADLNRSMKLIQYERDRFHIEIKAVDDLERPPMATLPEYRQRWRQ
jgi:glucosyl-3-phosphoglycerate synthase